MTRNFQLGAAVVCVAALAGIYLNTRGHRELDDDGGSAKPASAPVLTAGPAIPSPPASPTATTFRLPADQPPLPKSAAEALAELRRRGLTLKPVELSNESRAAGRTAYRIGASPLGIGLRERDGKLLLVEAIALADKSLTGDMVVGFAASVGEVTTGLPREAVRRVVAQTLADVGNSPRGFNRTIDDGKQRFKIDVTRHDDGAYSVVFTAE